MGAFGVFGSMLAACGTMMIRSQEKIISSPVGLRRRCVTVIKESNKKLHISSFRSVWQDASVSLFHRLLHG